MDLATAQRGRSNHAHSEYALACPGSDGPYQEGRLCTEASCVAMRRWLSDCLLEVHSAFVQISISIAGKRPQILS